MYVMKLIPLRNEWSRFGAVATPHHDAYQIFGSTSTSRANTRRNVILHELSQEVTYSFCTSEFSNREIVGLEPPDAQLCIMV
jgi:hypothetical protein